MKKTLAALALASATIAHAELPVVEIMDPAHVSSETPGTITAPDGTKHQAVLKTFGSDKYKTAQEYGRRLARMYVGGDLDDVLKSKGRELYGTKFSAQAFDQVAKQAYKEAMAVKVTQ